MHHYRIRRDEIPNPDFFDFFFFELVGFTSSFSSSESDKKTCLRMNHGQLEICQNNHMHNWIRENERSHTSLVQQAFGQCCQEEIPQQYLVLAEA